jgi:hypothetical protein
VENGNAPSREDLLAQYPDWAEDLREYFEQKYAMQRVVRSAGLSTGGRTTSLHWVWMLFLGSLLVVGMSGCGNEPRPLGGPNPETEVGRDAAIAEIKSLGGSYQCDSSSGPRSPA